MPTTLTMEILRLYFDGQKTHKCYKETKDLYDALRTHADGIVPEKLIHCRRPSESGVSFSIPQEDICC
jgi:hypothetical protein